MKEQWSRTALLLGEEGVKRLWTKKVAVFGIGGVGSYAAEALARSGIGSLVLTDNDVVSESNINRQLLALHSTVGRLKTEVMRERIKDIDPEIRVTVNHCFFLPETADQFPFEEYDYVIDAVDTVAAKLAIILRGKEAKVPVISAMGAGNKLDGGRFRVADLSETRVCPLARVMRRELKKRGIEHLKVVYSEEEPKKAPVFAQEASSAALMETVKQNSRPAPGSLAFVPSAAGLLMAGEVVRDLIMNEI